MGRYETYAFEVLSEQFRDQWSRGDERFFSYGLDAGHGSIDGVLAGRIAVEVGVGSPKQIRAGILDLALHPASSKLLVLVDTDGHSTDRVVLQAEAILDRLGVHAAVVRLVGSLSESDRADDRVRLHAAVKRLL